MNLKLVFHKIASFPERLLVSITFLGLLSVWGYSQAETPRPSYTEEVVANMFEKLLQYQTFGDLLKDLEGDDWPKVRIREYIQSRKIDKILILPRELRGSAIVWKTSDSQVVIQDFSRFTAGVMLVNGKEVSIKQIRKLEEIEQDLMRIFTQPQAQWNREIPENTVLLGHAQSMIDFLFSTLFPRAHAQWEPFAYPTGPCTSAASCGLRGVGPFLYDPNLKKNPELFAFTLTTVGVYHGLFGSMNQNTGLGQTSVVSLPIHTPLEQKKMILENRSNSSLVLLSTQFLKMPSREIAKTL